ncbi:MAG: protoporphyrinogen oxidase [Deltaproteobacteria bacterium]|nr:protoporphyrinogen oxidase [Deltaproteobacteria bacterium]
MHRIIVVGGGISGLAAAHRLTELKREKALDLEITLLEAQQRLGGSIATERREDFLVEAGPDSFISEKPWALRLCERLGLSSRLLSTNPGYRQIYVVHKNLLRPLPDGFYLLAPTRFWPIVQTPLFSWRGKLRMAAELFLPRMGGDGDESLASFVRRRFGQEVLDRVAQPLVGGIYAADPEKLSVKSTMPRFLEMEREKRSVTWAMWRAELRRSKISKAGSGARWSLFVTLAGGMQELVDALANKLQGDHVRLGIRVAALESDAGRRGWVVITSGSERIEADGVILSVPSFRAAKILSSIAPEAARELHAIAYSSTATVTLAYRRTDIPHPLDGFGFVVPAVEKRKIIACTFSSIKYSGRAPEGCVLLRAFVGGALEPSLFAQDDTKMETSVRQELADLLGVTAAPLFCRISRHARAMPQYPVGHQETVRRVNASLAGFPGLALSGNAYHGVGMADCIHSGEEAAEKVLRELKGYEPGLSTTGALGAGLSGREQ